MPRPSTAISRLLLLSTLGLVGCGSASSATTEATKQVPKVAFKSTAIKTTSIPAQYTCDGKNAPPPFEWGSVPKGTGELALFIVGFTRVGTTNRYSVSIEWAVAGLDPSLHRLTAGKLPAGAHVGLSSGGKRTYSLCPEKGQTKIFQFELFGVPGKGSISKNFRDLDVLAALNLSNRSSPATAHGFFEALYKRKK